jgi:hypothetical protein
MTAKLLFVPDSLNTALFLAANGFALWKGRTEERTFALYVVLGSIGLRMASGGGGWGDHPGREIFVGAGGLIVAVSLSLNTDKWWPLAAASLQLVGLATTIGQQLLHFDAWAYGTAQIIWDYTNDLIIAWGTYCTLRARSGGLPVRPPA